ncbi:hypothetical protein HYS10_01670 [Candidatus Collierbacteria bacterium]|nr:hypothetical protein [Candidatus Collierbacteria bacterium]
MVTVTGTGGAKGTSGGGGGAGSSVAGATIIVVVTAAGTSVEVGWVGIAVVVVVLTSGISGFGSKGVEGNGGSPLVLLSSILLSNSLQIPATSFSK